MDTLELPVRLDSQASRVTPVGAESQDTLATVVPAEHPATVELPVLVDTLARLEYLDTQVLQESPVIQEPQAYQASARCLFPAYI